jgi:hypothetical protein
LLKVDPSAPHDTLDEEIAKSLVTRLMVLSRTEFDLSAEIEEISRAGFIVYAGHRDKVLEGGRVHPSHGVKRSSLFVGSTQRAALMTFGL